MIFLKALPGGGVFFVREWIWIWRWISLIGDGILFWGWDVGEKRTPGGIASDWVETSLVGYCWDR